MCGIAGIYSKKVELLGKIRKMTLAQEHRGPDSEGHVYLGEKDIFFSDNSPLDTLGCFLALGHRRLAIIDQTNAGIQPMSLQASRDWITYNGEVYNYLEIKKDLQKLGYSFQTETDTEVILTAYKEWGTDCFSKFNGMWAIAIWDNEKQQLVLSRDRLGVKPLHYAVVDDVLLFSSEIKGILATGLINPELDINVAMDYLKWSITDHNTNTFFKNILSFPAGNYAVIKKGNLDFELTPFWSLNDAENKYSYKDASGDFLELFEDSLQLRLRSDVEIGACLSGGLDSSSIVCVADKINKQNSEAEPINTFHSAFEDPKFDERKYVDIVNTRINAKLHMIFPTAEDFKNNLEKIVFAQETPFASASIYAQWKLMELANSTNIKVLLDGQGADEILCGYRKFYYFYLVSLLKQRRLIKFSKVFFQLLRYGDRGFWNWKEGYRYLPSFLRKKGNVDLSKYLTTFGKKEWDESNLSLSDKNTISKRQIDDVLYFSIPVLLRYEDRNSMSWSIETRVPFLDYRLVEWAVHAPTEVKMSKGQTKAVMRDSLRKIVPDEILDRKDKMGFVTAQELWMRSELVDHIKDSILSEKEKLNKLLDVDNLIKDYDNWLSGVNALQYKDVFRVYILAVWLRVFNIHV